MTVPCDNCPWASVARLVELRDEYSGIIHRLLAAHPPPEYPDPPGQQAGRVLQIARGDRSGTTGTTGTTTTRTTTWERTDPSA
ncbi:MAG: hypothetical protein JWO62_594 [Acidimicrobiaceae bacterium]|nr:hypothetical protein [Acidimicrobiaceae bacterium]